MSAKNPTLDQDADYSAGLRISLGLHGLLIALILIKSIIFPGKPLMYVPTLRVDVVGLPDVLKKDMKNVTPSSKAINDALKKADQELKKVKPIQAEKEKAPPADPKEMVLHPKANNDAAIEKKMKESLNRMKALAKIEAETSDTPSEKTPAVIKGNKISKGTSLSGEAREAAEASYYDSLRDRLQDNWALPVWIARQNYSAQVQIFIDAHGALHGMKFVKTSGNAQFDDAVKRSVQQSAPFPAPPDALASQVLANGVLVGFPL